MNAKLASLAGLALLLAVSASAAGPIASTPVPVKVSVRNEIYPAFGGEYLTWSKSRRGGPSSFDVYVQRGSEPAVKLNAKGTLGYAGGTDGIRVAYQQARGPRSDIRLYDLATKSRSVPPGVNTKRWEWRPSISGSWLLFGRGMIFNPATQQVLLRNLVTGEQRVLDSLRNKHGMLQVGQVNGNYAVWMKCVNATCSIYRYDILAGTKTQLPTVGKTEYAPSVSATGTTYYGQSAPACGAAVELMKVTLTGVTSVLYTLPAGQDFQSTFAVSVGTGPPPGRLGTNRIYFDLGRCHPARTDIYSIDDVEPNPPPS